MKNIFAIFLISILFSFCCEAQVGIITTIAGNGTVGFSGDGGAATAAEFYYAYSVAVDGSGNVYIADEFNNRIRKINTAGEISTYAGNGIEGFSGDGGAATAAELHWPISVAVDVSGNLYIGDFYNFRIRKVNTSGIISTFAGDGTSGYAGDGGAATAAEIFAEFGLATDIYNNIYFTTDSSVRKINTSGIISTFAGNGTSGFSGDGGPATAASLSVVEAITSDVYGNIYISDAGNDRVRKVNTSGIISTFAGNGTSGFSGDGGPATAAEFADPLGITTDASGNIYISDEDNYRIRMVSTSGIINTFAGTGVWGFSGDGGPATTAKVTYSFSLATDVLGNIYITDIANYRVRKVIVNNDAPHFTGGHSQSLSVCENSSPNSLNALLAVADTEASLTETWSLAVSPVHGSASVAYTTPSTGDTLYTTGLSYTPATNYSGIDSFKVKVSNGYAADTTTILVTITPFYAGLITPEPAVVCPGSTVTLNDDTSGGTWSSANPGIATITSGGVVTGVSDGNALISYTVTGSCGTTSALAEVAVGERIITTIAGTGTAGYSGDGGPAITEELNGPWGIAIDVSGNLYIGDYYNNRIRKIATSGIMTTIAGTGTAGYSGDGGAATAAEINKPVGVAVDNYGNVYFADNNNYRIRKVNTSGYISTVAGTGSGGHTGDGGPATSGKISAANGIAVDAAGNLYIADYDNHCVRKVDLSGIISTFAGTGTSGHSGDGGPATNAEMGNVNNVGVDNSGNVYIADYFNYRVRIVNAAGIINTLAGTGTAGFSGDGGAATAAEIQGTAGIITDNAGNIYIGDVNNDRIRVINTSGIINTYAGTVTSGFSGDGGPATSAELNRPNIIVFDANGNMYVVDINNYRIREISSDDAALTTILGPGNVCEGIALTLTDRVSGGTWSSSNTSVAIVGTGGVVTGVSEGSTIISYSVNFTCGTEIATKSITVSPQPGVIGGISAICLGASTTLTDTSSGGSWVSSSTAVATISSSTGIVTGVSGGVSVITYLLGTGCLRDTVFTVNDTPTSVSGPPRVCLGSGITLTDSTLGGTWSSSNSSVAYAGSGTGIITGLSVGTATITYSIGSICNTTTTVTVNNWPSAITGTPVMCAGATTTLSDGTAGGSWSSGNTSVATAGSSTGLITGVSAGTAIISYFLPTGCYSVITAIVNPLPSAIAGFPFLCAGATTSLIDGTSGGTWSSSNATVATVGTSTGLVTGVSAGTAIITYRLGTGCLASITATVNPLPVAITGTFSVCESGGTTTLADATAGGTWSSTDYTIAEIGSITGIVTGVVAGTTAITYTLTTTGCMALVSLTVNPAPVTISGITTICLGYTTTLSDLDLGGSWSSPDLTVGIGTATGIVSGITLGSATITYTLPTGCYNTVEVVIYPNPASITGLTTICQGATTIMGDATPGGTWSSSNTSVAPVIGSTGMVTGLSVGTAIITYSLSTGCNAITTVTVTPVPTAITGPASVCAGTATTLSDGVSGGAWSSSNTAVATIGSSTSLLTGVSAGTTIITYSIGSSCRVTRVETVLPAPTAITGATTVCAGATTTLYDPITGGAWSSGSIAKATVGTGSGIVTGVATGSSIITYSLSTGCAVTTTVVVTGAPTSISGASTVCACATITLSDGVTGGNWSSSSGAIAIIGTTGIVTGASAGTAIISYSLGTGCLVTKTITVLASPVAITGSTTVCAGAITSLFDVTTGGTWISGTIAVATIGTGTGMVTGVATVPSVITYTLSTGCAVTTSVNVTSAPTPIAGALTVCAGATITLTDGSGGGSWSSSTGAVATIGTSSGIVAGVSAGTAIISYSLGTGCLVTKTITVLASPVAITGSTTVCAGAITSLFDVTTGGTWISGTIAVATIGTGTGMVTGVSAGTSIITYSLSTGCAVTTTVNVTNAPTPIAGASTVCAGATITLTDGVTGGNWTSSTGAVATIGTTGIVTGVSAGTAIISYSLGTGCLVTKTITVLASPVAVTGSTTVCEGATTTLYDATTGGTWSSGATAIATIGAGTGIVSGVSAGTSVITYSLSTGCVVTTTVNVSNAPTPIAGASTVCPGAAITLTDGSGGGSWSSSSGAIATIGTSSGIVAGVSAGTAIISYSLGTGCLVTKTITVFASPAPITGTITVCAGAITNLYDATTGGTWSSGATAIATIGAGTGIVSGVSAGTSVITYSLSTGCVVTTTVNVSNAPTPIAGVSTVCPGAAITLTDGSGGGSWSSSTGAVATIGTTGIVTGASAGTAIISYSLGTGCLVTKTITVFASPAPITGTITVCAGAMTNLYDATTGGTWNSGVTAIATIGAGTGMVTGVSAGTSIITYSLSTGCSVTTTVNVSNAPTPITGASTVCPGATITLTDGTGGGSWSSSTGAVATIGTSSGIVAGVSAGTTIISYSLGTGCLVTKTITVFASPAPITGATTVCAGAITNLYDATTGGTWNSGATAIATIGAGTGMVTGVSAGTSVITYSLSTGCVVTTTVNVSNAPTPIAGVSTLCPGAAITLTDGSGGGSWSSSSGAIATIGTTGIVTGASAGTAIISYSLGTGCLVTKTITVFPSPSPITGSTTVCEGATTTLFDATTGGTWSSGATSVATVGAGTGIVTGVTTGTAIITYSLLSTGCSVTIPVTVSSALPSITGTADVCVGATAVLTDSVTGGVWSASGIAARIGSITGVVTGVSAGTAIISYLSGAGCMAVTNVTVNPLPPAITGIMQVCAGLSTSLYDASTGGLWSCGSSGIAGISATGVVTGVSAGTATISYTAGCTTTAVVTVNPLPGAITGAANGCAGLTTLLMDSTAGGTWSSGNRAIATIDTFSGVMRGISGGVVMITYTLPTGCITTSSLSINPTPLPITGGASMCNAASATLSDPTPGGTWSSGALGIATVSGAGTVTGVSAGTAMISYAIGGCAAWRVVLINPLPAPITGPDSVCEGGATMRVYDADSSRGLWTSTLVTIVDTTGVVTGYLAGMGVVTYTLGTGCSITRTITVTRLPAEIVGGVPYLCIGATVDFTDASASGAWSTSSAAVATVGSGTGMVTGIATGIAMITYTIPTGCFITQTISVNPQPAAIEGPPDLCVGASALFGDSTARGVWVSGATGIAAIGSASGIARGVSAGPATITYSITNSCGTAVATKTITVNPLPNPGIITGPAALCQGDSGTIADIVPGGSWSLANGVVNLTSGMVTGISPGIDTIVYTVANTWCANSTSYVVTIHPLPSAGIISGPQVVCQGATITLIDDAGSGAWSASNADASAAADGTVTGIAAGMDSIFYSVSNTWCSAVASSVITVNPLPDAGAITGPSTLCAGDSLTLQDPVTGGTWSCNNTTATVSGGLVKGIATGVAAISYAVTNSCGTATATHTIAIGSLPDAGVITGSQNLCAGDSIILSDNAPNGVWVSGDPLVCAVSSGVVTAIATGTDTIMYQVTNSCGTATAQYPLTIYPSPPAPVITQGAIMVTVPDNYLSYQWSLGGKSIPGATTNSYTYSPWSVYNVTVTNTYGCAATAQPLTVTDCSPDAIVIYPNPASEVLNILWCKNVTAIITTIDGRKLKTVENTDNVELGDLPNGAYMLVIFDTQGNKVRSMRFSKISR